MIELSSVSSIKPESMSGYVRPISNMIMSFRSDAAS